MIRGDQNSIGHTVEKIGGTSMSRFDELIDTILIGSRQESERYNRVFVVSAYAGITDALLEHKKSGKAGVYATFANADEGDAWKEKLDEVQALMLDENTRALPSEGLLRSRADFFVVTRIREARQALENLQELTSYGHFQLVEHLPRVREMLASLGEAHSAHNAALRLNSEGVSARFVDLTGWNDAEDPRSLDELLRAAFETLDLTKTLPFVTGYARCEEGLMGTFDRGYSEMTFSRLACVTGAREAIIHKEYHLSSADPRVVGEAQVFPIGRTNYDVADQLSNLGMEAIHPKAAKGLRQSGIDLCIKNAFEPEHPGTRITLDYRSPEPCVEIIAGRENITGIEIFDQEMLGTLRHERRISAILDDLKLSVASRDSDANSLTYYVDGSRKMINRAVRLISEACPEAEINLHPLSIVSAVGSDLKVAGMLAKTVQALASEKINVQAIHQSVRQVEMQCLVVREDYARAIKALHRSLIESQGYTDSIAAA